MTIEYILNSELSDSLKIKMISILKDGGAPKKEESEEEHIARLVQEVIAPAATAGNLTARRLMDIDKNYYTFTQDDIDRLGSPEEVGTRGNVKVGSRGEYLTPSIQYRDGKLVYLGETPEWDDETEKQSIKFPSAEEALFFGEHYHSYPNLIPTLRNIVYKKQGGNMTLDEILNSNISDSAKVEFMKAFAQGGVTEKDDSTKLKPTESITIGDQDFDVEIADTEEKRKIGLSKVKELKQGEGMLFVFDSPVTNYFTMKETSIDLDIIFIDEDGEVIEVKTVKALDKDPVECSQEYQYVLETTPNTGLQRGDELELDEELTEEDNDKIKKSRMLVLDSNGDVQMKLVGGERIVSMIKTRLLVKAALKAFKTDEDKDYRRVGRIILQELDAQDSRDPEYIEKP